MQTIDVTLPLAPTDLIGSPTEAMIKAELNKSPRPRRAVGCVVARYVVRTQ